jgi:transcriptional regulator with XRE-family HTH domain
MTAKDQCDNHGADTMGQRLRERRKQLKLTLNDVSSQTSLSTGFISQIERGITTPSLSSLANVCRVLDLDVGEFFNFKQPAKQDDPHLLFGLGKVSPDVVTYERLSASFPDNVLRSTFIHEPPGLRSEPMSHEGEEIFYVVSGELTLEIDGETFLLRQGDTAHFPSTKVHQTYNHTNQTTIVFHVCTMDVFGEQKSHSNNRFGSSVSKKVIAQGDQSSGTNGEDKDEKA